MSTRALFPLALPALLALLAGCADGPGPASSSACDVAPAGTPGGLSAADVETIIAQAVSEATNAGLPVTVTVVDHEGNVLGVFAMAGANPTIRFVGGGSGRLESFARPLPIAAAAAISKAGTAAFLSTQGHAFSSRTASFIVQQHFPPGIDFTESGPLFGVQFSSLPCNDTLRRLAGSAGQTSRRTPARLPLGLAGDPGGMPLYKGGVAVGGIGIEGDGVYSIDFEPAAHARAVEERIAIAGSWGFAAPLCIRADQILVNGIRLPFANDEDLKPGGVQPFAALPGQVVAFPGFFDGVVMGGQPSRFERATLGASTGTVTADYPVTAGSLLSSIDVTTILRQAAEQAEQTRAAIRRPIGDAARVNVAVVDVDGRILGVFRTLDAPVFGFDVAIQKARTASFLSSAIAGAALTAGLTGEPCFASLGDPCPAESPDRYTRAAAADGLGLDGSIAFSDRAVGFLARPFFPDGIDATANGPFSRPFGAWSVFNDGLQADLVVAAVLQEVVSPGSTTSCTRIPQLRNGIQIFPGSVPLYKNGRLAGAIGVSGDGVDQDDYVATAGSVGFEVVPASVRRSDDVFVRGVRLPFVKFPANPKR